MTDSPEQVLAQQKANCVFCRIIAGEMDSRKVFEDDHVLAVLDIRPAAPGHVLVLPKEHAPIPQMLKEEDLLAFCSRTVELARAVKEAMIAQSVTVLLASGYAAGQQAPHTAFHLIPREPGDGLDMLDLERREVPQADALALASGIKGTVAQVLTQLGRKDLVAAPRPAPRTATPPDSPPSPPPSSQSPTPGHAQDAGASPPEHTLEFEDNKEALLALLSANPQLRNMIIAQPDLVEDYVRQSPKLQGLFKGVDIQALSAMLRRQDAQSVAHIVPARELSEPDLFAFIDKNEGLRKWLLEHPEELAQNIGKNPRLAAFFEGTDIMELAQRYRAWKGA